MALKLTKTENAYISTNDSIFKGLNPEQAKAVSVINGPALVIAGAGSGKTRVLTYRIANLIQNGVAPENILALTFTNKAADEMKDRIAKIAGITAAGRIWAGTFHSVFARILRYEAATLGYTSSFSIYDTDDSLGAIRKVMQRLNFDAKQLSPQSVQSKISSAKNKMLSWEKLAESATQPLDKQAAEIYGQYQNQLFTSNAMDFDDLLLNIIKLFERHKESLEKYQNYFKYILVDEYQDTNRAQYIAVNMLAAKYRNLFVVGDDAQSIYRWRGADIRNILDFERDYPDAAIVRLEQNYRSTKTILLAADSVIKNNSAQIPKQLWTDNLEGEKVEVLECDDDREEAEKIAAIIKQNLKDNKLQHTDFAVLYRTNAQALAIENSMRKFNLPYIVIGGISFYRRKEIKDTLAYLKILVNPKDSESFERALNEPPRGLGPTSMKYLRGFASLHKISLYEAFCRAGEIGDLQTRAVNSAKAFTDFLTKFIENKDRLTQTDLVLSYIDASGMLDMYREIGTEDALDRLNNIQQLLSSIQQYLAQEQGASLESFLQQISLVSDIDVANTSAQAVRLMTLHSAKGLEFPYVFIAGMEDCLFPLKRGDISHEEEEEERRLFYVGITRAEKKLFLSFAKRRLRFGELQIQSASHFLSEIDKTCLNWKRKSALNNEQLPIQKKTSTTQSFFGSLNRIEPSKPIQSKVVFNVGDTVRHTLFGIGRIEAISGIDSNKQATVNFRNVGIKKLVLQFAKLEKVK